MRALQLIEWKKPPEFRDVPEPEPGPGAVVVRIAGAGACHSDLHLMHDFDAGMLPWGPPFTLGHENAGWIDAVGAGVVGFEIGQPVGGVQAELLRDTSVRIVPLTDRDASEMVRSLRSSPLLFGFRGAADVDVSALEEILLRVGLLADQVPEIAELDCNPVVVSSAGAIVVDVKIRLAPVPPGPPPGVRRLRDA